MIHHTLGALYPRGTPMEDVINGMVSKVAVLEADVALLQVQMEILSRQLAQVIAEKHAVSTQPLGPKP